MKRVNLAIFVILAVALSLALPALSSNSDKDSVLKIYLVKNIKIENMGEDQELGKMQALDDGKAVAFTELIKRFQNYGYINDSPKASFETVEDSVKNIHVIEELVTENSYEARVNYEFEPIKILEFLKVERNGVLPKNNKYILVPAYIEEGVTKPWHKQWMAAWKGVAKPPITLASGNLEDIKAVNSHDLTNDRYYGIDKIAHSYRTPVILLAEARYDRPSNTLNVQLKRFEADARLVTEYKYPGVFGIGSKELLVTAATDIMAQLSKNGVPRYGKLLKHIEDGEELDVDYDRNYQSEKSGDQKLIYAVVATRSLSDWSAIRRKLINTKLINSLSVSALKDSEVNIQIYHIGEIDELTRSLGSNGLTLKEVDGKYQIDRQK